MGFKVAAPAGGDDFEIVPAGNHIAVCCLVAYVGWQDNSYEGKARVVPQIIFSWELTDERTSKGEPFVISQRYTAGLHEKHSMRKMLESWRSVPFTKEELAGFDVIKVLGKPCLVAVAHKKVGEDMKARVKGIASLPKGTPKPTGSVSPLYYSVDQDPECCDIMSLPEWIRKVINARKEEPMGKNGDIPADDGPEEIPF